MIRCGKCQIAMNRVGGQARRRVLPVYRYACPRCGASIRAGAVEAAEAVSRARPRRWRA